MTTTDKGRPLPKFGDWDAKNPASAEGFTVIFQKARDDKKTTTGPGAGVPPAFRNNDGAGDGGYRPDFKSGGDGCPRTPPIHGKKKWFFCTC